MNFRTKDDNGQIVIHNYKRPSSKATTYPRTRDKMRKSERKRLERLAVRKAGYVNASKSDAGAFTEPGSLK